MPCRMPLANLKRTASFTRYLTADSAVPTVEAAKTSGPELLRQARAVSGSFTWLSPERIDDHEQQYELVGVSSSALEDLGVEEGDEKTSQFLDIVAGKHIFDDTYPWAQAYAGWQFGQWAGQLGDGRAVSLFEATNPITGKRYELQLKGAGLTPYSRFADGKAVLRSSIREALGSEAVYALGIPTTRALSIVSFPHMMARRETLESCAIVCRMAETWVRIGTFDLHRARGNRSELRKLADYCIDEVFGGVDNLIGDGSEPRYERLYREIVARNAGTTALWQAYGFLNGVLNTDNISILGLTIDYGPFAFLDTFDANYTPNHDDGRLRYSYKNTPTIMLWNLVRLGEDLGELLGAGAELVDDPVFIKDGVTEEQKCDIVSRAENIIRNAGGEFQAEFLKVYNDIMRKRLALVSEQSDDHDKILTPLLDMLQDCELDYNQFFRKLGDFALFGDTTLEVDVFFPKERGLAPMYSVEECKEKLISWIEVYKKRLQAEGNVDDGSRQARSRQINPRFVLKGWILDEVIHQARKGDFDLYRRVQKMALSPFNQSWGLADEDRFTGDTPRRERDLQCSCSS
jgi:uncharacterized protein YdiU (UPF0061 family)